MAMRGQVVAISLVLACGVAMFIMSTTTLASLKWTMEHYYREHRFADVFAHVKRAPEALVDRIAEIPGVARVQTRIVAEVSLHVAGQRDPAAARLISMPDRARPVLNEVYLRRGRWLDPQRAGEILLGEAFADVHDLRPGDSIQAVINQRMRTLTIAGIVLSPEFVYEIREGEMLPDPARFGVIWMSRRELAAAFDLDGAFNNVALQLLPGASRADVIARLDDLTERYGGLGAFGRDEQRSHQFVAGELDQLRGMALIVPAVFLAVTAFLFNMVMSRTIKTQREQIAALKAFGYTRWEIAAHYASFVGVIVLIGVVIGLIGGMWLGQSLIDVYIRFFRFPVLQYRVDLRATGPALILGIVAGLLGAASALRDAMRLPPAEAMRPEPPADFRPTVLERIGLQRAFSPPVRMVLRNIERRPIKSVLTCLGIAMAMSILILGNLNAEIIEHLIRFEFAQTQRQDVTVTLVEPAGGDAVREFSRMPGVLIAEGFRAVPVRVRFEHRQRRSAILGLAPDRDLLRLLDAKGREVHVPDQGLLMSKALATILHARVGDAITVDVLEGRRGTLTVALAGVIEDYTGLSVYMNVQALREVMREQDTVSGAFLRIDHTERNALFSRLRETPRVGGVTIKAAAIESFRETIAENLLTMRAFTVVFAAIIAFGVIYNSTRISLAERGWELATLRVIGFTRGEISMILLGELAVLTLAAVVPGMLLGRGLAVFTVEALQTEHQRLPMVLGPRTYGFAVAVTIVAAVVSGLVVRRRLDRLDLIGVLKSRA